MRWASSLLREARRAEDRGARCASHCASVFCAAQTSLGPDGISSGPLVHRQLRQGRALSAADTRAPRTPQGAFACPGLLSATLAEIGLGSFLPSLPTPAKEGDLGAGQAGRACKGPGSVRLPHPSREILAQDDCPGSSQKNWG